MTNVSVPSPPSNTSYPVQSAFTVSVSLPAPPDILILVLAVVSTIVSGPEPPITVTAPASVNPPDSVTPPVLSLESSVFTPALSALVTVSFLSPSTAIVAVLTVVVVKSSSVLATD